MEESKNSTLGSRLGTRPPAARTPQRHRTANQLPQRYSATTHWKIRSRSRWAGN